MLLLNNNNNKKFQLKILCLNFAKFNIFKNVEPHNILRISYNLNYLLVYYKKSSPNISSKFTQYMHIDIPFHCEYEITLPCYFLHNQTKTIRKYGKTSCSKYFRKSYLLNYVISSITIIYTEHLTIGDKISLFHTHQISHSHVT